MTDNRDDEFEDLEFDDDLDSISDSEIINEAIEKFIGMDNQDQNTSANEDDNPKNKIIFENHNNSAGKQKEFSNFKRFIETLFTSDYSNSKSVEQIIFKETRKLFKQKKIETELNFIEENVEIAKKSLSKYLDLDYFQPKIKIVSKQDFVDALIPKVAHFQILPTTIKNTGKNSFEEVLEKFRPDIHSAILMKSGDYSAVLRLDPMDDPSSKLNAIERVQRIYREFENFVNGIYSSNVSGVRFNDTMSLINFDEFLKISKILKIAEKDLLLYIITKEIIIEYLYTNYQWINVYLDKRIIEDALKTYKKVQSKLKAKFFNKFKLDDLIEVEKHYFKSKREEDNSIRFEILPALIEAYSLRLSFKSMSDIIGTKKANVIDTYLRANSIRVSNDRGLLKVFSGFSISAPISIGASELIDYFEEYSDINTLNKIFKHPRNIPTNQDLANINNYLQRIKETDPKKSGYTLQEILGE